MTIKPGTKVKIIDTSGQFPKGLMGTEGEVIRSLSDNRSLVRIPNQTDTWIYNFRLEEIKDEQEKEVR